MDVALFVPCYVDQFYPQVAIATMELLEKHGCMVHFPKNQTCCGQPMANAGYASLTAACNRNYIDAFEGYDAVVAPSGSCVLHIREHLHDDRNPERAGKVRSNTYELTEFLTDVLKVKNINATFPHKVGLHVSCHGQRMLGLASMSEKMNPPFSKAEELLQQVKGISLLKTERWDECCGFGGTFCVTEEAVSVQMGKDRVHAHEANEIECIAGGDMSCLMHLEGILKRNKSKVRVLHFAEILNGHEFSVDRS